MPNPTSDFTHLLSAIRAELITIETAVTCGGESRLAAKTLHTWCGLWQRRAYEILNPTQVASTDDQQRTARINWAEFTRDTNVIEFCEKHQIILAKGRQWYWCTKQTRADGTPRWGAIIGLEKGTRGVARITNGVDVWIEREDGSLFLGHQDWFKGERRVGLNYRAGNHGRRKKGELTQAEKDAREMILQSLMAQT